LHCG
jgi:hypothetical protein